MKLGVLFLVLLVTGCTASTDDGGQQMDQAVTSTTQSTTTTQLSTFRGDPEIPSDFERARLPECDGKVFTTSPVDMSRVYEIAPRGNIAPPGHTFPTDHNFIHLNAGGTSTEMIELYSPADVYVTHVATTVGSTNDPEDSVIYFALCKDVIGYYNHVKELSLEMQQIVKDSGCEGKAHVGSNSCLVKSLELVEEGTIMGKVGRLQGNFDFGLFDLRKPLDFVSKERFPTRTQHMQCPFDYYDDKNQFFDLIERNDEEQCGVTMQDVAGTLKGNWFHADITDNIAEWDRYLAFVNENQEPEKQSVSIGGVFTDAGKWTFIPNTEGLINREFADVTADGNVYCYETENNTGKVLIQLVNEEELNIEHQSGSCSSSNSFNNPSPYRR